VWQVSVQLSVMVRKRKSWGHSLGSATAGGSAEKPNALATPGSVALGFLSMRRVAAKLRYFHHPLTSVVEGKACRSRHAG